MGTKKTDTTETNFAQLERASADANAKAESARAAQREAESAFKSTAAADGARWIDARDARDLAVAALQAQALGRTAA